MTAPNILLIMADQLAPHFTGAYGHPVVKTPHLDALAARGTRFDAAYCNAPLCAPARFSFMAGQLPTRIAAYDNASEFPSSIPTFAHYLRAMGYHTCLTGKMHFVGPDQLHGFEERLTTDVYPADFAWTPDWEDPGERIGKWYHNMDSVRDAGIAAATFQLDYDDEVAFTARRRLFDYARNSINPFCMVTSFIHPHDPYDARQEWWDLYDPDEIDMPKTVIARADQDPHSGRVMDGIESTTANVTDDQIRNARHAYYANVSYIDNKIGELLQALDETGLSDNTIIVVTADHGDMLGERNLWYKMSFLERSARVPLIVAGPGVEQRTISSACSLVDLLPTMMDIASVSGRQPPGMAQQPSGRSLLPYLQGADDDEGEAIGEYCGELASHPLFMIRRGAWKYIHCDIDPPQMFNLDTDPEELNNLAGHPDHQERVARFAAEVMERWDSPAIRADVIASQKSRRAVYAAMTSGSLTSWDYQPSRDASNEFVRNHMDWTVAQETTRFPPLKKD
jgi:choline-sulfatase